MEVSVADLVGHGQASVTAKLGSSVRASVEIIAMEGRRITLSVRALAGDNEIGSGQHERVIVNKEKFLARLAK